jgi:hypothetical protein
MVNGQERKPRKIRYIHILLNILLVAMVKHLFLHLVNETHLR